VAKARNFQGLTAGLKACSTLGLRPAEAGLFQAK
jgi:hypothetical protein